jgi:hypothetical protein
MVAAVQGGSQWYLMRTPSPDQPSELPEAVPTDELLATGISADQSLVLTVQRRDGELVAASYFVGSLEPVGEAVAFGDPARIPSGFVGNVAIASCGVAWPERRDDGTTTVDLRIQDLDADGRPVGVSRLLNSVFDGDHFSPTLVCMSPQLGYATFMNATGPTGGTGGIRLRKVPAAPAPED